jgi:putative FmdB family regulatory protein
MPRYEYVCRSCGHVFEIVQAMTDASLTECPLCGGQLRKVFAPPAISFKGSGFYATDHREKPKARSDTKPSEGSPSDGSTRDSKPLEKKRTDTKPADSKRSDGHRGRDGGGADPTKPASNGAGGSRGSGGTGGREPKDRGSER